MTPELRQFLTDWLAWAEAGAPEVFPHRFATYYGLCSNLEDWASAHGLDGNALLTELEAAYGGDQYPFGQVAYDRRCDEETQHEDPARLAWVRAQLAAAEVLS